MLKLQLLAESMRRGQMSQSQTRVQVKVNLIKLNTLGKMIKKKEKYIIRLNIEYSIIHARGM